VIDPRHALFGLRLPLLRVEVHERLGRVCIVRRQQRQPSLTTQFRGQERIDGQWTVWGRARALGVDRNGLYARSKAGTLPAERHPLIGHYLIPETPDLLEHLRSQRAARPWLDGTLPVADGAATGAPRDPQPTDHGVPGQ